MLEGLFTLGFIVASQLGMPVEVQEFFDVSAETRQEESHIVVAERPITVLEESREFAAIPNRKGGGDDEDRVQLSATSVYAFDRTTGKPLYEKNATERVAIASITKLMTALVVVEQEDDLDRLITVPTGTPNIEGSTMGLLPGEVVSLRDLLYGLLVKSGNDAGMVIAEEVAGSTSNFVRLMNLKARDLGLENTHFANPTGLDDPDNYSTAFEVGQFANVAFNHDVLRDMVGLSDITITSRDYTRTTHYLQTTNKLLAEEGTGIVAGKTGFTDEAGLCLVSLARRSNHEIINVVLGSEDRAEDTRRLTNWEYNNYVWER